MYEYFIGKITDVTPYYIVINVGGVGYRVLVANPFRYTATNDDQKVYIYQAVRDNDISLYGFQTFDEKQLFIKLLSVSGIGPKSALAILANEDHSGLINAINTNNDKFLTKFPGIGKKTAQQIILDLKGKMKEITPANLVGQQALDVTPTDASPALRESLEALASLGYTKTDIKKVGKQLQNFAGKDTNEYLSQALHLLNNK
ncbi:Holliday junction branch migration protein RuvA [Ligilactobacillus saerimneri]|uniref:Holliday junction branch migration complex subunit RuvA n=1 Tax=Ligilactobacillus saerimneri 30a TaxID=1227363 RepID=M5J7T0_9LACO|nr:Holliday junction branch migration protein RuvA [Ligilactobacillus saerimneri]EKW99049.1 Holliday junction DNA helicase RuvA [Ligilactobacillus saerimneri 30a]KRL73946.1 holliday junction dna helicase ruva [Ligilactobacillus saerimneri DSM 16049]MCZ0892072.1 Holliday junction branch migration protein RuvA [Ligilactobacillus saerimneri]MDI9206512.1 Holliday junction branch migration protein RuvA [Ligilactobacillus saerimneri]HJF29776.1 Holliday junction branch migration protein RuvA [Ligilac